VPRKKAEEKRFVAEAKKNIRTVIDRNLSLLEKSLEENSSDRDISCIRGECAVGDRCIALIKDAIKILEETKGSFHSRNLAELRKKLEAFLEDEMRR